MLLILVIFLQRRNSVLNICLSFSIAGYGTTSFCTGNNSPEFNILFR